VRGAGCSLSRGTDEPEAPGWAVVAAGVGKLDVLATIDRLAALLAYAVPGIGTEGGRELVAAASLYANALWPVSQPPAALAKLYESDPEIARACVDFVPML
jgi:Tetracyclin repressor-like, C-terminal domain